MLTEPVQPGDKLIRISGTRHVFYTPVTVARLTKTLIILTNEERYRMDGTGFDDISCSQLSPLTPEIEAEIERKKLLSGVRNIEWSIIPLDKLRAIIEILERE